MAGRCVLLLLLLLGLAGPAAAQSRVQRYFDAAQAFEALAARAASEGTVPRLSTREVAEALAVLSDDSILRDPPFQVADLPLVVELCGKAHAADMAYMLFDLKNHVDAKKDDAVQAAAKIRKLMEANSVAFQDEIFLLLPFSVRCLAAEMPLVTAFYEALPESEKTEVRKQGARQARDGAFSMYGGGISAAVDERISPAHRMRLLAALADTADLYATMLAPERRADLMRLADAALSRVSEPFKPPLVRIRAALRDAECGMLCRL